MIFGDYFYIMVRRCMINVHFVLMPVVHRDVCRRRGPLMFGTSTPWGGAGGM